MANHASTRTTQLYDRQVTLDEIEQVGLNNGQVRRRRAGTAR
ncbi:MAG TPA: hypothetical protein VMF50_13455 [Candidatus Binataceae bacterium]|nr:hypothetical protein [Candidatus Binataceae bacterium]